MKLRSKTAQRLEVIKEELNKYGGYVYGDEVYISDKLKRERDTIINFKNELMEILDIDDEVTLINLKQLIKEIEYVESYSY